MNVTFTSVELKDTTPNQSYWSIEFTVGDKSHELISESFPRFLGDPKKDDRHIRGVAMNILYKIVGIIVTGNFIPEHTPKYERDGNGKWEFKGYGVKNV